MSCITREKEFIYYRRRYLLFVNVLSFSYIAQALPIVSLSLKRAYSILIGTPSLNLECSVDIYNIRGTIVNYISATYSQFFLQVSQFA